MGSETEVKRSIALESRSSAVARVWEQILSEMEVRAFGEEDVFAVHLSLEEAFLNAVKHGNKSDAGKKIIIDYSIGPTRLEISVGDEGNGFDPEFIPDPRCDENLYKAQGRGLLLIRSYMDEVMFNERGNVMRMVKYIGKQQS